MKRTILQSIIIITTVIIQVSMFALVYPLSQIKLVLIGALTAAIFDYKRTLLWVLLGGILLDVFSVLPFLSITLSLFVCTMIVTLLLKDVFTHGSLYAFTTVGIIGIVAYHLTLVVILLVLYLLKISDIQVDFHSLYSKDIIWQIGINVLLILIVFWRVLKIQKKFVGSLLLS